MRGRQIEGRMFLLYFFLHENRKIPPCHHHQFIITCEPLKDEKKEI